MYTSLTTPSIQQPKRRRPALACRECRRRKVKCNRLSPCDQCTKMGIKDSCTFASAHPAPEVQKPAAANPHVQQKSLPNRPSDGHSLYQTSDGLASQLGLQVTHPPQLTPDSMVVDTMGQEATIDEIPTDISSQYFLKGREFRTRLYGRSSWVSSFLQLGDISSFFASIHGSKKGFENNQGERYAILDRYKDAIQGHHPEKLNGEWHISNVLLKMPTKEFGDVLVGLYLETFGLVYRIFHITTFWSEYNAFWNAPEQASVGVAIKILLVMAVGTCFVEDPPADLQQLAHDWIRMGQVWLNTPFDKSRLDLTALQVHCLLLLARQTSLAGGDLIWISSGSLIRTATLMGLHRDSNSLPAVSVFCAEIRRRLWYTILEIDLQCTLDGGLPFLLGEDDYDAMPPQNINDEDISFKTTVLPPGKPNHIQTQSSFQCALVRSLPVRMAIVTMVNKVKFEGCYDKVLGLHHEFMKYFGSTPDFLRLNDSSTFQQVLFDLHVRRFLLTLHRPFASKAGEDPRFYFSRKVCIDSCMTLLSHRRMCAEEKQLEMLLSGGGGMFRDEYFHATLGVCLEMIAENSELGMIGSSYLSRSNKREMNEALRDFLDLCELRISRLENGSKIYLLLSIAMAGCKAREEGKNSRSEMAQELLSAAETTAQYCYNALRERRGLPPLAEFLQTNEVTAPPDLVPDPFELDDNLLVHGVNIDELDFSALFSWNFDEFNSI